MLLSFWRIIKFSFQDMGRNFGMSFMTVLILILMLLSVNALWSVDILTKEAVQLVRQQINVSIYFSSNAKDSDVKEIEKYIRSFPEVVDLKISSRDEVLESFKNRHRLSKDILAALQELGGNPFGPTIVVKTREPGDYKKIITALSIPEYDNIIESKSYDEHQDAIGRIQDITSRAEKAVAGLAVLFALISFLIIFNTVRVAIHSQRVEISIKRLVGANNWFIRGPYFIESLLFSVISLLVTIGLIFFALKWVDPYLSVVFPDGFSLTNYYNSHIFYLFGIQFVCVLALTVISSSLAMRRQLKV